ncbi:MAG: nicotinate-nicotinamide nucleotide adenylyltransferase [Phycisphaeraceae bacterium]|nr:nicotinate-nicotinamide nucleotide adenylyltransferase [Phycisphaeraceae bacterium]
MTDLPPHCPPPTPPEIPRHATDLIFVGGTFDPPHFGHTRLPVEARSAVNLDSAWLIYVPAAQNPLKDSLPRAGDANRLAMLELAIEPVLQSAIWDDELARARFSGGPSYTVDSLRRLRTCLSRPLNLRLLLGSDQALSFHRWRDPREILELARPIVMLRGADALSFLSSMKQNLFWSESELGIWEESIVPISRSNISSTRVRDLLRSARGKETPELAESLSPAVLDYIRRNHLYRC